MASLLVGLVLQDGFVFGTVHSGSGFSGDEVQQISPNLYFSGLCDPAVLKEINGLATEGSSLELGASVVPPAESLGALLASFDSPFLVGEIDVSGPHLLAFESKAGTAKPCKYTAMGHGAETADGVLSALFVPGMNVEDGEVAVMRALYRVIVVSEDFTLNGSVFIIGSGSLLPKLNIVFKRGRGHCSRESFFIREVPGEGTAAAPAAAEARKVEKVEESDDTNDEIKMAELEAKHGSEMSKVEGLASLPSY